MRADKEEELPQQRPSGLPGARRRAMSPVRRVGEKLRVPLGDQGTNGRGSSRASVAISPGFLVVKGLYCWYRRRNLDETVAEGARLRARQRTSDQSWDRPNG